MVAVWKIRSAYRTCKKGVARDYEIVKQKAHSAGSMSGRVNNFKFDKRQIDFLIVGK